MAREPMFNNDQVQKMKDAYVMGNSSLAKIGADFGVSVPTVAKYLRNAGTPLRGRGRPKGSKNMPKVVTPVVEPVVELPDPVIVQLEDAVTEAQTGPEVEDTQVETPPFRW